MTDFSLRRDFKYIQWGPTLLVNFVRSVSASLVWVIIAILVASDVDPLTMLLTPIMYFAILLPIGLVSIFLNELGVPFVWFLILMALVTIIPGDPLTFIIHKILPRLVPTDSYGFLNFRLIIFVLEPTAPSIGKQWWK